MILIARHTMENCNSVVAHLAYIIFKETYGVVILTFTSGSHTWISRSVLIAAIATVDPCIAVLNTCLVSA